MSGAWPGAALHIPASIAPLPTEAAQVPCQFGWSAAPSRKLDSRMTIHATGFIPMSFGWRAQVELPATSHFSDLFEAAIAKAVSGSWRMGGYSGAWKIRAQK